MMQIFFLRKLLFFISCSHDVSHVVSEYETVEQTLRALKCHPSDCPFTSVVSSAWLSRCIKSGAIVNVEDEDRVPTEKNSLVVASKTPEAVPVAEYACQRTATLQHPNHVFTHPLEVLEEYAEFKDDKLNYSRALAFRRASAVLKSLPLRVTSVQDVINLPDIGGHCLQVIQDVLENGFSDEAKTVEESDWYKKMKLFTCVFGVGPATSKKWIHMGVSTVAEAANRSDILAKSDPRVSFGLEYFDDLNSPVEKSLALEVKQMIQAEVETLQPGTTVELAGGFRRGKEYGHDIDLLITHPNEGSECGILKELLHRLEQYHIVLYGRHESNTFQDHVASSESKGAYLRSNLDHFEKWIGVIKTSCKSRELDKRNSQEPTAEIWTGKELVFEGPFNVETAAIPQSSGGQEVAIKSESNKLTSTCTCEIASKSINDSDNEDNSKATRSFLISNDNHNLAAENFLSADGLRPSSALKRSWIARRLDLIVIPQSQYYYGLVGWTGNKHFNRSLRFYAQKELGMKLTSHGLFDAKGKFIPAKSEKEVFENLKLPYQEPHERNC